MKKKLLLIVGCLFFIFTYAQDYRYTNPTLFSATTIQSNVTFTNAPFIDGPLHTVESSTTNGDIKMDIFTPTGDSFALRPAIIFTHGGGFITGNKNHDDMMAFCDLLAKKGYVTATIDYRQGFNLVLGNTAMHSTRAVYRGFQDGRSAVRFLRANAATYGIDPSKVYFAGSSAGAFIALHAIYLDAPSEKPAACNATTYTNVTIPFFHTAPDLGPFDIGNNLTFNGKPDAVVSLWGAIQSTNLITSDNTTPVLLVHGEADATVPFNTGSPFGYSALPTTDGSNPIKTKLDVLSFTNNETYFVAGEPHEFYGVNNGTWSNGTGGNAYWPIVVDKVTQFLWKQHKPTADYSYSVSNADVTFSDISTGSLAWWWDFGDGSTSNSQNPNHNYTTSGNYQVKLYVENNIKSWDEITKTVNVNVLSTAAFSNDFISIYPNPTNDFITLNVTNSSQGTYYIFDISGKIVMQNPIQNKELIIDMTEFSQGIYFIKITTELGSTTKKIIKN